jgi:hypothetical protein
MGGQKYQNGTGIFNVHKKFVEYCSKYPFREKMNEMCATRQATSFLIFLLPLLLGMAGQASPALPFMWLAMVGP